jgi:hypothetical protein
VREERKLRAISVLKSIFERTRRDIAEDWSSLYKDGIHNSDNITLCFSGKWDVFEKCAA